MPTIEIETSEYAGPSRRKEPDCGKCGPLDEVHRRLDAGDKRMGAIETKIDANSSDTSEVLDILRLGKSFFRLAGYFGEMVKWGAGLGAALIGLWLALKSGGK